MITLMNVSTLLWEYRLLVRTKNTSNFLVPEKRLVMEVVKDVNLNNSVCCMDVRALAKV